MRARAENSRARIEGYAATSTSEVAISDQKLCNIL